MKNLIAGALVFMAAAFVTPVVAQQADPVPNTKAECNRVAEELSAKLVQHGEKLLKDSPDVWRNKVEALPGPAKQEFIAAYRYVQSKEDEIIEATVNCYVAAKIGADISPHIEEMRNIADDILAKLNAVAALVDEHAPANE